MKTIFDQATRHELIARIQKLEEVNPAQWGKMNAYQMVKHCRLWEEMNLGKVKYKRVFLGYLFGKMALRNSMKDDRPMARNAPTIKELRIIEKQGEFSSEKEKWIMLLEEYPQFSNPDFIHPFFGKMTKEQIGFHAYKHNDHHLRQFSC